MKINILETFLPVDRGELKRLLSRELSLNEKKIVVLDDDPTGVQTVHDVSVYTGWDEESIREGFAEENRLFYILTNSRGLTAQETAAVHREIIENLNRVSKECKKDYLLISRSDSTLRGHYPLETEILRERYESGTGRKVDGEILCPYFREGGRYTIGNVHYVQDGEELLPAHETEFARDKTFGYTAPTLPEYIEEKTKGAYRASEVLCISLEELRSMDIDGVEGKLLKVEGFGKVVVNAVEDADLEIFSVALYRAMRSGKTFLFRSAASLVKVLGGISDLPLLDREQMLPSHTANGGLIIVGSHTRKTTMQLERLKSLKEILFIEMDVTSAGDDASLEREAGRCRTLAEKAIADGRTVCCYTTRKLMTAGTKDQEDELRLSVKISEAVQSLAGGLQIPPAFLIAKGGITSSDIGTKALRVKKAKVLGQVARGIPVWQTGQEGRFPSMPYVIFPGNVGADDTLLEVVKILLGK